MNLARHVAVLWRFRVVTAGGLLLGLVLAVMASYHVPSLTPRGEEVWTANSSLLVTQPGFPEGRVTLPEQQVHDAVTAAGEPVREPKPKDQVEFADPARLSGLADLYTKFIVSDDVLGRVPGHPKGEQVQSSPFLASSGGLVLPVIQLATMAPGERAAERLNEQVFRSLAALIAEQQEANDIGQGQRVEVKVIDAPKAALTAPRKHTASILALMLCLLGTVAVVHLLEALRSRLQPADDLLDWESELVPDRASTGVPVDDDYAYAARRAP